MAELTYCGSPPGGKTRREEKPPVFIRFDVPPQGAFSCPFGSIHLVAVKAGINLRGCGPLTTLSFLEAAPAAKRGGRFPVYLHNFLSQKIFYSGKHSKKFCLSAYYGLKKKG